MNTGPPSPSIAIVGQAEPPGQAQPLNPPDLPAAWPATTDSGLDRVLAVEPQQLFPKGAPDDR